MHSLRTTRFLVLIIGLLAAQSSFAQERKALTFEEVMHFKAIRNPVVSDDGGWLAYAADPDRGDGEVVVRETAGEAVFRHVRGGAPAFSKDSKWLSAILEPAFAESERAKDPKDRPQAGLLLLNLSTGEWLTFERVKAHALSKDSQWLAIQFVPQDEAKKSEGEGTSKKTDKEKSDEKRAQPGSSLVLRSLVTGSEHRIERVASFAFSPDSAFLVYGAQYSSEEEHQNAVLARDLASSEPVDRELAAVGACKVSDLVWNKDGGSLAFAFAEVEGKTARLFTWDGSNAPADEVRALPEGWSVGSRPDLKWTRKGDRLYFGLVRKDTVEKTEDPKADKKSGSGDQEGEDLFSLAGILEKREVDVWHWNDPLINSQQKKVWEREKDRSYRAVLDSGTRGVVRLGDEKLPEVETVENGLRTQARSDVPYLKEVTWDGRYHDSYVVNLSDGTRELVAKRIGERASLSPKGQYVAYYDAGHWFLYDAESRVTRNLTQDLDVPVSDELHDYPSDVPSYESAGWLEDDSALLIYDRYDVWQFSTADHAALNLTGGEGRKENRVFRLIKTDPDQEAWKAGETVLLSSYHDLKKNFGFYSMKLGQPGVKLLLEEEKKFGFAAKAKDSDTIIYTRESYTEFPDLWVTNSAFDDPRKLTEVNPQVAEYAWGSAELVEWNSLDGIPLQGVLIKPGNYEPGKKYPVLVYFYRLFSQRLHEFSEVVINHRPLFPFYASNGYAIFLPDVRFEIGRPGFSATKCIVPGVQKLIDMGIADPQKVALHGHSWSGYQTAFVITQTNIFAAAIAGAPVSNMTSAYSGIRWETGLARQFQYEKTQSRIGGTLWEVPERYIENSPVFFADKIQTPLLLMFGDEDGAVPWYQGIELYLAMRRLEKDAIFLEYRGEGHHPKKYANKLDYTIRMKEYLDHYLLGVPAPKWISEGVPYQGK